MVQNRYDSYADDGLKNPESTRIIIHGEPTADPKSIYHDCSNKETRTKFNSNINKKRQLWPNFREASTNWICVEVFSFKGQYPKRYLGHADIDLPSWSPEAMCLSYVCHDTNARRDFGVFGNVCSVMIFTQ